MNQPKPYQKFKADYPEVEAAYDQLGQATAAAGPLEEKSIRLVKLALAIGAGLEGAVHAQTRKALAAGLSPSEIRHAVVLAATTIGFPRMMAARTWVEDILIKS